MPSSATGQTRVMATWDVRSKKAHWSFHPRYAYPEQQRSNKGRSSPVVQIQEELSLSRCLPCSSPCSFERRHPERLPDFVEPFARMTIRHCQQISPIGLATCGKGGSRLATRLGIRTTRQTILRRIMALPDFPAESILFLGIDDFSFLRGRRFGTILVNLETRHVVHLLPDRTAETSAAWMRHYPDLMAVSRDRGGDYASAAKASAPQATEVG